MPTHRERLVWARQAKIVKAVDSMIGREDADQPAALDEKDREAVRVVVRIAAESDGVFRAISRKDGPVGRTAKVDHLCDSIEAGMDFFSTVKQSARIIQGVKLPRTKRGSVRSILVEHAKLFEHLQRRNLGLPRRLSILLELIRIELIFFGHVW
jgi:hypothetical protein